MGSGGCFVRVLGRGVGVGVWGKGDVSVAFLLHFGAVDEVGDFSRAGVDSGEGEDIEEEDAAVVEEVAEGFLNEFVVCVGEEGDLFDGIDAVDVREDEQHGKVPIGVGEGGEVNGCEGDVVRVEGRGRGVCGEEFDVEGGGGVEGDHSFGVVV